jgi:TP901 family phage tail tape measure protein
VASMRTIGVKLRMETGQYVKDTGEAVKATDKLKDSLGSTSETGKKAKANWDDVGRGLGLAGAGLIGLAGAAVLTAASFDKQMSEVGAVANATGKDLDGLRAAALDAGKATVFSASEAAKAEAELAKAGVSTANILGGALTGSLALAAAGTIDLTEAATVAAQAMNIFHLGGSDVGHIADVLAASANKSATDVHEMGEALKMGGLVAQQFGLGIEDTAGTLALFADNALVGSDAGTSLKTMLIALASPSDKASSAMKDLGIQAYDASGQFVGVADLAGQLHDKLGGLSDAERNTALSTIFGTDAMRAAGILMDAGKDKVNDYVDAVNDQGAAADVAAKKTDNLAGDVERLKGSLETLAIGAGSAGSGGLRVLVQTLDHVAGGLASLPGGVTGTGVAIAGLTGTVLLGAGAYVKAKSTWSDFLESLSSTGAKGEKAAGALGKIGGVVGKIGGYGALAGIALVGVSALVDYIKDKTGPAARDVDKLSGSLSKLAMSGKATGELAHIFGDGLEGLSKDLELLRTAQSQIDELQKKSLFAGGKGAPAPAAGAAKELREQLAQAQTDIAATDAALAKLVQGGNASQANKAFNEIRQTLLDSGVGLDEINAKFPQYADAASAAAAAQKPFTDGLGELTTATGTVTLGIQEMLDKGLALKDILDQLTGATTDSAHAQINAEQALDNLTEGWKKGKDALDLNTQAGRDNMNLVLQTTDSLKANYEATYKRIMASGDEAGALGKSQKEYDKYIDRLKDALHKLGLTDGQISSLIHKYAALPPKKTTTVEVHIKYIESGFGNSAYAQYFSNNKVQLQRWGGVTEHAQTGLLKDPAIYNAVSSGVRYAFAEPATGGEAFVPKRGDYGRSMSILDKAAGWYGASVVPRGAWYGGGGQTIRVEVSGGVVVEGNGMIAGFRREIAANGGNVQAYLGPTSRRP